MKNNQMYLYKSFAAMVIILIVTITLFYIHYRWVEETVSDDISKVINKPEYQKLVKLNNFTVYKQSKGNTCGLTTISMIHTYLKSPETEGEILAKYNLQNSKSGMLPSTFLKYLKLDLDGYNVSHIKNIPDSEVLKLVYEQLDKGMPVPAYFSTINDWNKPNYDTHYSAVIGIDLGQNSITIANTYGYEEQVSVKDFLKSLKFDNYLNKPLYFKTAVFLGIIKKNNIYIINKK